MIHFTLEQTFSLVIEHKYSQSGFRIFKRLNQSMHTCSEWGYTLHILFLCLFQPHWHSYWRLKVRRFTGWWLNKVTRTRQRTGWREFLMKPSTPGSHQKNSTSISHFSPNKRMFGFIDLLIKANLRVFPNNRKQAKINIIFHFSPSLGLNKPPWFWIFEIRQFLLMKQLTSSKDQLSAAMFYQLKQHI